MQTPPRLPLELWGAVLAHLADLRSAVALAQVSRAIRGLVQSSHWAGLASIRLSPCPLRKEDIVEAASGLRLPVAALETALLPRCAALRRLELADAHASPTHAEPGNRRKASAAVPSASRLIRAILRTRFTRSPALTTLVLTEQFAASVESSRLVTAFAASLRHLSVSGCHTPGPKDSTRAWNAVARCRRLRSLHYGFCKGETSVASSVSSGLAGHVDLESLTLRGLSRLTAGGLLAALNSVRAKNLQNLSLESMSYTNEVFMEATMGPPESQAAFARLSSFRMNKCGYIFAPLILSVMPRLKELQVSLAEMSELVKLALSFVVEYSGNADKPRHSLTLVNDLSDLGGRREFRADAMLELCRLAIRDITRKFSLHFDVSLVELAHPVPEAGGIQARRFVMGKGRAQVYMDTFYRYDRVLPCPPLPATAD